MSNYQVKDNHIAAEYDVNGNVITQDEVNERVKGEIKWLKENGTALSPEQVTNLAKIPTLSSQLDEKISKINYITINVPIDFSTITQAINSITNNNYYNRYVIKIAKGTYQERLIVPNFVELVGEDRDTTKIEWDRPLTTNDSDVTGQALVEFHNNESLLKNLTITGSNWRYMVHIEFYDTQASMSGYHNYIDNCTIIHKGNDSKYTWQLPHAIGQGLGKNDTGTVCNNSKLIGGINGYGWLIHDAPISTSSSCIEINNCSLATLGGNTYKALGLDNYNINAGDMPWYVRLNNCNIQNGIQLSGSVARCKISGSGNNMTQYITTLGNYTWIDNSAGYFLKNTSGSTIQRGKCVKLSSDLRSYAGVFNGRSQDKILFCGIAIEDIPHGEFGYVVFKGEIQGLIDGTCNYLDEVTISLNSGFEKFNPITSGFKLPIGIVLSPSSTVGQVSRILLSDSIQLQLSSNTVLRNNDNTFTGANIFSNNVTFNGVTKINNARVSSCYTTTGTNIPSLNSDYIGQFFYNFATNRLWIAKNTGSVNIADDWQELVIK